MPLTQKLSGNLLDILTKVAIFALTAVILTMLVQHRLTVQPESSGRSSAEQKLRQLEERLAQDKLLYKDVAALAEQRQHEAALGKLKEIDAAHPDNPRSLLWQGQLQYELGLIAESLASYRQALDREPDYIDKKSPLFVGKDIKRHVDEAQEKLQREATLKPGDASIKKALEELLYVKRRLAGGCE
jgi:tetratricopeptide (TPR) repeat protein